MPKRFLKSYRVARKAWIDSYKRGNSSYRPGTVIGISKRTWNEMREANVKPSRIREGLFYDADIFVIPACTINLDLLRKEPS